MGTFSLMVIFSCLYRCQYRKEMHRSCVPKILQNTIYEISNNRENFDENPSMRAIVKILRAQTSEHLSKFCEEIEQRPNFASTLKFQGTICYPYKGVCVFAKLIFFGIFPIILQIARFTPRGTDEHSKHLSRKFPKEP